LLCSNGSSRRRATIGSSAGSRTRTARDSRTSRAATSSDPRQADGIGRQPRGSNELTARLGAHWSEKSTSPEKTSALVMVKLRRSVLSSLSGRQCGARARVARDACSSCPSATCASRAMLWSAVGLRRCFDHSASMDLRMRVNSMRCRAGDWP
jgi:hypothetical protein